MKDTHPARTKNGLLWPLVTLGLALIISYFIAPWLTPTRITGALQVEEREQITFALDGVIPFVAKSRPEIAQLQKALVEPDAVVVAEPGARETRLVWKQGSRVVFSRNFFDSDPFTQREALFMLLGAGADSTDARNSGLAITTD